MPAELIACRVEDVIDKPDAEVIVQNVFQLAFHSPYQNPLFWLFSQPHIIYHYPWEFERGLEKNLGCTPRKADGIRQSIVAEYYAIESDETLKHTGYTILVWWTAVFDHIYFNGTCRIELKGSVFTYETAINHEVRDTFYLNWIRWSSNVLQ